MKKQANRQFKILSTWRWFIGGAVLLFIFSYLFNLQPIIPLFLLSIVLYAKLIYKDLSHQTYRILNISLIATLIFVSAYFLLKQGLSLLFLPFSSVSMLAALLFNNPFVALITTFVAALLIASLLGNSLYIAMLFIIGGALSIVLIQGARRRSIIMRAGLISGLVQGLISPHNFFILVSSNLLSSIIVLGSLPLFEYLFHTITNISLLELADFNHPLLNRMMLEAPGTYHHSLIVGNLSEAASRAIGANSLLSRIGAYYHDIGKLEKPQYFSENQNMEESKHDELSPTMSKLVIMNHVKEGVELAKAHKLNPELMKFIQQHHGNSLVYYFYRKALENLEDDQEVKEEGFRYPGPRPETKETAIVLLADSVEAATRAMKNPTPSKIKEVVHKVINNKFIDGQLDECDLTLKDLEKISEVFIHILTGIYHSRVSYPDEKSRSNGKKHSEENSNQS
ncbi:HDIG domain-containing protein [bacterium]|nr:MAG: HDIG domain-containing protein [bacterium]